MRELLLQFGVSVRPRRLSILLRVWFVCLTGMVLVSPGFSVIVINEIHYNPDVKTEQVEFIELCNTGVSDVSFSGWQLTGGIDYVFPAGTTIAAGGYLVVAQNPSVLQSKYGITALGPWGGRLDNSGEEVSLKNAFGDTEDKVEYRLGFPWPTVGDAPGCSIELMNPAFDNNLGGNWRSSSSTTPPSTNLIEWIFSHSVWSYRKGTSEPPTNWMETGFSMDGSWLSGQASIGYGDDDDATVLTDMRNNYSTIYLRQNFVLQSEEQLPFQGVLDYYLDDGAIIYLNGVELSRFHVSAGEKAYNSFSGGAVSDPVWEKYDIPNLRDYLVVGTNTIAVHMLNMNLHSSDLSFDIRLTGMTEYAGLVFTPGAINSTYTTNAPPKIRQVNHSPKSPVSAEEVVITAKITDSDGVVAASLLYQIIEPGSYIGLNDSDYENSSNWTAIAMNDSGIGGDAMAGDEVFTVVVPASVQRHRRLVRYRISASDGLNQSLIVPYSDDPQPNFAYFCYDGVPAWRAAVRPGVTGELDFSTNIMRRIPSIHLIAKNESVEDATWLERYRGDVCKWEGTLVYDGRVYDHIHYRARGGIWRYAMCKNMWKFDFNRGHDFQMRDDYGRKYRSKWRKLNLGASIQQGNFQHRGEQGMFESTGSRFFNLAGLDAFNTSFLQLRIIDDANEVDPSTQYEGDFWGLYLAVEQLDGRFLDEHDLPDGNFYKMEGGSGELNNTGLLGPTDKSDLNYILDNYTDADDGWWSANWELAAYYSYQTIVQGIHHYDINARKNFFYYSNPETGRWKVIPWDLDLTWADNMFNQSWGGRNALADRILDASASDNLLTLPGDSRPEFRKEFRNRVREIRDLLFNDDQGWQVIDECANLLRDPADTAPSFLDADRAMWDYNPKMSDTNYTTRLSKAGTGQFYQWTESGVSNDFNGCVQLMKNYVVYRGGHLDNLAADAMIPDTPAISFTGDTNHPLNGLSFSCSAFSDPQGVDTFASMEWRAAEVLDASAPAWNPAKPPPYEINAKWESGELPDFNADITIPVDALKVGHAYRVRARMKDETGRWSHWSNPVQFVVTESSSAGALISYLRVSEVMYDPLGGNDYEFIELHNISTVLTLKLGGAAFTEGVNFNFPAGTIIEPGGYLLVIRNASASAFRTHYGLSGSVEVAGAYSGKLANKGDKLTLKTGPGGLEIAEFSYSDSRIWPLAAAGAGHSIIPLNPAASGQATGALDYPGNWRASTFVGGSPGTADPAIPVATVVLNEIVAHTDYSNPSKPNYDSNDWIELCNTTDTAVSLEDWYLSDDPANPAKSAIPAVSIPAGGHLVFNEVDDFHSPINVGFGLDKAGEQVLLSYLPGTAADRVVDAVGFRGQENDRSLSRFHDGTGLWCATLRSPAAANSAPLSGLRLAELMYQPPLSGGADSTRDEYVEIYNPTATSVTMQNAAGAWRLAGGIEYTFPVGTVLPAGGTLLVVGFDPADATMVAAFTDVYSITNSVRFFGPYSGRLGNRSERVSIEKPQLPDLTGDPYSWVIEDEVVYGNQNPWPASAAGAGSALERISMSLSGRNPANWHASSPTPGFESLDRDGDGMPSRWEDEYSLNPGNPADAAVDSDGDGLSNIEEYWCGTRPDDSSSVLKFEWARQSGGVIILEFSAVDGKSYSVQSRTPGDMNTWRILTNLTADASAVSVSDPVVNAARCYRIQLKRNEE